VQQLVDGLQVSSSEIITPTSSQRSTPAAQPLAATTHTSTS
jgi:hypothetical protein